MNVDRTRSKAVAWMIVICVILAGMAAAARPCLAQAPLLEPGVWSRLEYRVQPGITEDRATTRLKAVLQTKPTVVSVLANPDPPAAGVHPASSNAELHGNPVANLIGVPLQHSAYFDVGLYRRSTNVIIIRRVIPLKPNEAWNLGPELYLPIATAGTLGVDERSDGSTTVLTAAHGPMIAAVQRLNARDLSLEAYSFGFLMPQTDSLRYRDVIAGVITGDGLTQTGTLSGPVITDPADVDEGLANFGHIASAKPVPKERISLANVAPGLLPFFNNAPVFGLPGTEEGDFWHRTQLSGDWDGVRTDLVRRGIFIDFYSTSTYQNVTSGGLKTGGAFVQNTQLSINIDTARAGLWSGGLFHFTVQSRYGSSPEETFTVGSYVPQYTGFVLPGPFLFQNTYPSEYFLVQSFTKQFSVVVGKISDVFIPDQTLFGDSFKYFFANFNLNKNPMTTNTYNPTALAVLAAWVPKQWLAVVGGVLDPFTQPNTIAANAFDKGVNMYLQAILSYKARGRPGQMAPSFNWSNQPKIDFDSPFGRLSPAQVPSAVSALLGQPPTADLPVNFRRDTKFVIANFSQYLAVREQPADIPEMLRSGQQLRGIGVFGRLGYAPRGSNTLSRDASVALFGRGLLGSRPYDSYGVGFYYNAISGDLKQDIQRLTGGPAIKNEKGIEVFYDFAITPAIRVNPGYQHVWDPLTAQVVSNQRWANVFLLRFNLAL